MNDRLIIKKAIRTFSRVGDMLLDEVEVDMPTSLIPHGNVDLMLVSLLLETPPVFFNFKQHTFYHCATASFKSPSKFPMEGSGKLFLRV